MSFDDNVAIRVSNLSKCYHIYEKPADRLKQFVIPKLCRAIPMRKLVPQAFYKEFWALKNVSFEIYKGETVGIIGRNGCGKTTLLQIICGTLFPTIGSVHTTGRIAALLALGSGFNPEFTGSENVYMNAAVLGLSNDEIEKRYDDIVAFADIGDYISQPVKTYSSGMMARLAFAVAINVDPDILVVDEALSVGDELFRRKCFSRIEAIRANGATILFVSHSGGQIVELCDRAILLDGGECLTIGMPKQIFGHYQKMLYAPADKRQQIRKQIRNSVQQVSLEDKANNSAVLQTRSSHRQNESELKAGYDQHLQPTSTISYESKGAQIDSAAKILTLQNEQVNNLVRGEVYRFAYNVTFTNEVSNVRFGMLIKTTSGIELGGALSATTFEQAIPFIESGRSYRVEFKFRPNLNTGVYFMNAGVVGQVGNDVAGYLHRLIDVTMFRILPDSDSYATAMVDFNCVPEIELIEV